MSSAFGALVAIESEDLQIRAPEKSKSVDGDMSHEGLGPPLDFGDIEMRPVPISGRSSPSSRRIETIDEVQLSSNGNGDNQAQGPISEQVQTIWHPYKNRFRVMAACLTAMANGMNDSAPGALIASLERFERHWNLAIQNSTESLQRLQHCLWHCLDHFRLQCPWVCSSCLFHQCTLFQNWTGKVSNDFGGIIDPWIHGNCHDSTFPCCLCIVRIASSQYLLAADLG
jgi:hypothetical protein